MQGLLRLSDLIEGFLKRIADAGAWAFIACIAVITLDVITRKAGFQVPGLGSTRLQELEWHLHAVLFCCWLGYAYIRNGHVRIDVFTGGMTSRKKVWLELFCCLAFALPYLAVALPYAHDFFVNSYMQGEASEAPNGLAYRWVIKGFLYLAFITVALAVVAVASRCAVVLFGAPEQARLAPTPFAGKGEH
ncbi:MAG: TRAP transporter small permease subunit [Burkholderiales bacterium]|nr:TRAP transporter small permease subunit [Burkholderiales bacterium]